MSTSLEIGVAAIDRTIKKLKQQLGFLERVGSNKTGYWKANS